MIGNRGKTAAGLVAIWALMVGLTFAAVPFYNWFCKVTGFAGTTSTASVGSDVILEREMTIRFDASLDAGMPWEFKPQQRTMKVKVGETGLAFYEAYNPTDRPIAGQASYNVTPDQAGGYFTKIECFCFTEQVLQPHERAIMPVSFYVDPAIADDSEADDVKEITLSYTFYQQPLPETQAALAPASVQPIN